MTRKIIKIDKEKCNGCGACVTACHEGAIGMEDGKAVLLREDYCDGLGDCLPACPVGAISFDFCEALEYNGAAVNESRKNTEKSPCACPGKIAKSFPHTDPSASDAPQRSRLMQWPCQIKLVPINAPYFDSADLLICADCAAYAYGSFHSDFMKNRITLIGCPKLDSGDYTEKLTEIIKNNNIRSLKVVRMEVPCCSGIERAAVTALKNSGKFIPWQVVTITTDGKILE